MEKIIIVGMDEENGIGKDEDIPWHYSEDMKHFREETTGHTVLMGRTTFNSLPDDYRPLPDRETIVLTRSGLEEEYSSVAEASSLEEAYDKAGSPLYIAGGSSVYRQTLEDADELVVTRIPGTHDCDSFFPEIDSSWIKEREKDLGELTVEYFKKK